MELERLPALIFVGKRAVAKRECRGGVRAVGNARGSERLGGAVEVNEFRGVAGKLRAAENGDGAAAGLRECEADD